LSGYCLKLAIEMDGPSLHIHQRLVENQLRYHGDAGREWIHRLPALALEIARRWQLTLEPPFTTGFVDYVTPVRRAGGSPAVLKLCFVDGEFASGAAALRIYDGRAAVRLLEADLDAGALLLERLQPGEPLSTLADVTAEMRAAVQVMRGLWQAPATDAALLRMDDWVAQANLPSSLPEHKRFLPWIDVALRRAAELLQDPGQEVLLHGDLHFDNILSSQRGWLAIDPKGIVGDPAWELAPLLINNLNAAGADWPALVGRRIDQLIDELTLDRERAYALACVRSLQSRFWSLRDDSQPHDEIVERAFHVAEELSHGA
jgi:streptomycin 6-kinase